MLVENIFYSVGRGGDGENMTWYEDYVIFSALVYIMDVSFFVPMIEECQRFVLMDFLSQLFLLITTIRGAL